MSFTGNRYSLYSTSSKLTINSMMKIQTLFLCSMTGPRMLMVTFIWVSYNFILSSTFCKFEYVGHALNKVIKDIINRYNVIRGRRVQ